MSSSEPGRRIFAGCRRRRRQAKLGCAAPGRPARSGLARPRRPARAGAAHGRRRRRPAAPPAARRPRWRGLRRAAGGQAQGGSAVTGGARAMVNADHLGHAPPQRAVNARCGQRASRRRPALSGPVCLARIWPSAADQIGLRHAGDAELDAGAAVAVDQPLGEGIAQPGQEAPGSSAARPCRRRRRSARPAPSAPSAPAARSRRARTRRRRS